MTIFLGGLQIALFILTLAGLGFYLWQIWVVWQFFRQAPLPPLEPPPSVSILVPVCGLEAGAWENWTSLCEQDYPNYNVLFGVRELTDPAVHLLKDILSKYPYRARWYHNPEILGFNFKISNLTQLRRYANGEIIVFVDSDIRVTPSYLRTVTAPFANPKLGVVTCGYFDHTPGKIGAALSALGRSLDFIPSILIARCLDGGLKFAIGPTIAVRSDVLDQTGGFELAKNRIGDDYRLGYEAWAAGYRVELSTYLLQNDCGHETLASLFARELRWQRTIRMNRGPQYYGMIFTFGSVYSVLLVLLSGAWWSVGLFLLVWATRLLQSQVSFRLMGAPYLNRWLLVLPLRDGMSFLIWALGCFGREISWRGRTLEVGPGGVLVQK